MMKREVGDRSFGIWLLGDSNPRNWQDDLEYPLDPRHPARHNIWTSVLDEIQDNVYRSSGLRVDTSCFFIRNAIGDPKFKPDDRVTIWENLVISEIEYYRELITIYRPKIIFSFGAFSFEFARRTLELTPEKCYGSWGARELGREFRLRIGNFNPHSVNLLPLLHTSISRGRYLESHNYFSNIEGANYFQFLGKHIAEKLVLNKGFLSVWIEQ